MIRFFHLQERAFPGPARNYGIRQARGRILAFTDSDLSAAVAAVRAHFAYHAFHLAKSLAAQSDAIPAICSDPAVFLFGRVRLELGILQGNART